MTPQIWRDLQSGLWALPNPKECLCRGTGWMLSNFGTWHKCPMHRKNAPHPEMNEGDDIQNLHLEALRASFRFYRNEARTLGFKGDWNRTLKGIIGSENPTPEEWVSAAEKFLDKMVDSWLQDEPQLHIPF